MKYRISAILLITFSLCLFLSSCTRNNVTDKHYNQYNVISFEVDSQSLKTDDIGSRTIYSEKWIVTNNSDGTISGVGFTVCFCDEDGNILSRDSRYLDVSLRPGQSIKQVVYTEQPYISSEVTNYEYALENGRIVEIDVVAQTIR